MGTSAKQNYITALQVYHKQLESAIKAKYGIDTKYLEVLSWGYHTTAIYVKAPNDREYLLKLADWSELKEQGCLKDIALSNQLRASIPTPEYLTTLSGDYTCRFEDKILRLSHYISGVAPLAMTYPILAQMVAVLSKLHAVKLPPETGQSAPNAVMLHGDLTPHNVLVAYGQLVAVLDFELSTVGRREYDLARTAFFSWNYMQEASFEAVASFVLKAYGHTQVDTDLFSKYVLANAQSHVEAVVKHQPDYDSPQAWTQDYTFATNQLNLVTQELTAYPAQTASAI
jgi:Ser/Thr protein kinase RdoA (MazF antagonist)